MIVAGLCESHLFDGNLLCVETAQASTPGQKERRKAHLLDGELLLLCKRLLLFLLCIKVVVDGLEVDLLQVLDNVILQSTKAFNQHHTSPQQPKGEPQQGEKKAFNGGPTYPHTTSLQNDDEPVVGKMMMSS